MKSHPHCCCIGLGLSLDRQLTRPSTFKAVSASRTHHNRPESARFDSFRPACGRCPQGSPTCLGDPHGSPGRTSSLSRDIACFGNSCVDRF